MEKNYFGKKETKFQERQHHEKCRVDQWECEDICSHDEEDYNPKKHIGENGVGVYENYMA